MEIPKDAILAFLQERGQGDRAAQAEQELPDTVDTERDSNLLERFGIDQQDLLRTIGSLPGLKEKLPGGLGDQL